MSKERLEEIKNSFLEGQHILFGTSWVSMPKESFDWLIKQVEKMEQLQQENEKEQKPIKVKDLDIKHMKIEDEVVDRISRYLDTPVAEWAIRDLIQPLVDELARMRRIL